MSKDSLNRAYMRALNILTQEKYMGEKGNQSVIEQAESVLGMLREKMRDSFVGISADKQEGKCLPLN